MPAKGSGVCQKTTSRRSEVLFRALSSLHHSFTFSGLVTIQKYTSSQRLEGRETRCMGTVVRAHLSTKSENSPSCSWPLQLWPHCCGLLGPCPRKTYGFGSQFRISERLREADRSKRMWAEVLQAWLGCQKGANTTHEEVWVKFCRHRLVIVLKQGPTDETLSWKRGGRH